MIILMMKAVLNIHGLATIFQNTPADHIMLILQGAVNAAVFLPVGDAAKVSCQAFHGANHGSIRGYFYQACGKGDIEVPLPVLGDSLDMARMITADSNMIFH